MTNLDKMREIVSQLDTLTTDELKVIRELCWKIQFNREKAVEKMLALNE